VRAILDDRVKKERSYWIASCVCGKPSRYASKNSALKMVNRGSCRHCKKDYRNVENIDKEIYRNQDGKWCSTCSGCKKEQSYTRKDHAKQSSAADWRCKTCRATEKSFSSNQRAGAFMRCFNKFKNSAKIEGFLGTFLLKTFALYTLGIVP